MTFDYLISCFDFLGHLLGYVIALGQLPCATIRELLIGNNFSWEVINLFNRTSFIVSMPGYLDILNNIPLSAPDWLRDLFDAFFNTIMSNIGNVIYNLFVPLEWQFAPLWLGVPLIVIRTSIILFLLGLVKRIVTGVFAFTKS